MTYRITQGWVQQTPSVSPLVETESPSGSHTGAQVHPPLRSRGLWEPLRKWLSWHLQKLEFSLWIQEVCLELVGKRWQRGRFQIVSLTLQNRVKWSGLESSRPDWQPLGGRRLWKLFKPWSCWVTWNTPPSLRFLWSTLLAVLLTKLFVHSHQVKPSAIMLWLSQQTHFINWVELCGSLTPVS